MDRKTNKVCTETVLGERFVHFVYERPVGRALRRAVLTHPTFSKVYGQYQSSPLSKRSIDRVIKLLNINMNDYEIPEGGYRSFNDFFSRKLRPGARPIDSNPSHLVSPADARVFAYENVKGQAFFPVKGHPILLSEMLGSTQKATQYEGGSVMVLRLCPADYHRFHFPCAGAASKATTIAGPLESVNPWALARGKPILDTNQRDISYVDSPLFGQVAVVEVGAMCVGSIVQSFRPGHINAGDEKGYFQFGGSTVVLAIPPNNAQFDRDLITNTNNGLETLVQMGESIGSTKTQNP